MATRDIVPRANNEGSIGTASKKWNKGYFTEVVGNVTGNSSTSTKVNGKTVAVVSSFDSATGTLNLVGLS